MKHTGTCTINPSRGDTAPTDWSDEPYAIVAHGTLLPGAEKFFQYMTGRPCRMARDVDGNPCVKSRARNASWQERRSHRRERAAHRRALMRARRLWPEPTLSCRFVHGSFWWVLLGAKCPPVRGVGQVGIKWRSQ